MYLILERHLSVQGLSDDHLVYDSGLLGNGEPIELAHFSWEEDVGFILVIPFQLLEPALPEDGVLSAFLWQLYLLACSAVVIFLLAFIEYIFGSL